MILTSPFHERTSALNTTGLWSHWSGHLATTRYQISDKFEYFAVRNSAGIFDSSPLFKYRIHGRDAESFLAGVLARDIRTCAPGNAQYTVWLDERGYRRRGRRHPPPRQGRVPADVRGAEPRLLPGPHRPARAGDHRGGQRGPRHARDPGAALARPGVATHPRRRHDPLLRPRPRRDRRLPGDGVADGLQRRPRLRAVDRQRRRAQGLGHASGSPSRATACCRSAWTRCTCCASRPACCCSTWTSRRAGSPGRTRIAPPPSSSASAGCSRTSPRTIERSSADARWSARSPTRRRAGA